MPAGRPPQKTALVESLTGPEELKARLRVILATLSGELTIAQACEQLQVGESRFHELRKQALEGALKAIEPGQPGRPGQHTPEQAKLQEMQKQLEAMEYELRVSKARVELLTDVPQVVHLSEPEVEQDSPLPPPKKRRRPNYRHRWP